MQHKPRQNLLYPGGELTRPYLVDISSTSNHAARQLEKAPDAEEPKDAKPQSDTRPTKSAEVIRPARIGDPSPDAPSVGVVSRTPVAAPLPRSWDGLGPVVPP